MRRDAPLAVLWRRKWIVVATLVVFVVTVAAVSATLPKVYSTQSTLLVSLPAETESFDSVQASQAIARSYADIVASPNFAERVAERLGEGTTADDVQSATSFEAVAETQLLEIAAEDPDPERAELVANVYADVVIDYSRAELSDSTEARLTLADAAPLPEDPVRPQPLLYVLVAAVLGLALGIALAFLRDQLDRRLRTAADVERQFDIPVLARIPVRGDAEESIAAFREAFRILRMNVDFAAERQIRSVAIVSGGEGEGKTTVVAQLARASAEVGRHVVAVEADLRRPALARALGVDAGEPRRSGLTNYLVEAASLAEVSATTIRPNLDVVPAGPLPPNPSTLLESRRAATIVPKLLNDFDVVFVDCPPLAIGADASVISSWVDGVVMVVDLQRSTDTTVREALRQLDAVHAPVVGLILNRDRDAEVAKYDYYTAAPSANGKPRASAPADKGAAR